MTGWGRSDVMKTQTGRPGLVQTISTRPENEYELWNPRKLSLVPAN
jgi:hypothetical protein